VLCRRNPASSEAQRSSGASAPHPAAGWALLQPRRLGVSMLQGEASESTLRPNGSAIARSSPLVSRAARRSSDCESRASQLGSCSQALGSCPHPNADDCSSRLRGCGGFGEPRWSCRKAYLCHSVARSLTPYRGPATSEVDSKGARWPPPSMSTRERATYSTRRQAAAPKHLAGYLPKGVVCPRTERIRPD